jgi:hypothetical protein
MILRALRKSRHMMVTAGATATICHLHISRKKNTSTAWMA